MTNISDQTFCPTFEERCSHLLYKTNDGDILLPHELKRLENAVNGFIKEEAMESTFKRYGV